MEPFQWSILICWWWTVGEFLVLTGVVGPLGLFANSEARSDVVSLSARLGWQAPMVKILHVASHDGPRAGVSNVVHCELLALVRIVLIMVKTSNLETVSSYRSSDYLLVARNETIHGWCMIIIKCPAVIFWQALRQLPRREFSVDR